MNHPEQKTKNKKHTDENDDEYNNAVDPSDFFLNELTNYDIDM